MNRTRSLVAGAVALGVLALAPTMASADPIITTSTAPEMTLGTENWVGGAGCTSPGGEPTWGGLYFRLPDYPGWESWVKGMEVPAEDGVFGWMGQNTGFPEGRMEVMFFCTTAELPDQFNPQAPGLLWASAVYSRTFSAPAPAGRTAVRSTSTKTSAKTGAATATAPMFAMDRDALPLVDTLEIPGARAARLKGTVDRQAKPIARVRSLHRTLFDREATASQVKLYAALASVGLSDRTLAELIAAGGGFQAPRGQSRAAAIGQAVARAQAPAYVELHSDADYVAAAGIVLTGNLPAPALATTIEADLARPMPRVQAVERIALTAHSAAWYQTH